MLQDPVRIKKQLPAEIRKLKEELTKEAKKFHYEGDFPSFLSNSEKVGNCSEYVLYKTIKLSDTDSDADDAGKLSHWTVHFETSCYIKPPPLLLKFPSIVAVHNLIYKFKGI